MVKEMNNKKPTKSTKTDKNDQADKLRIKVKTLIIEKKYEHAINAIEKAKSKVPQDYYYYLMSFIFYVRNDGYGTCPNFHRLHAVQLITKSIEINPTNARYFYLRAVYNYQRVQDNKLYLEIADESDGLEMVFDTKPSNEPSMCRYEVSDNGLQIVYHDPDISEGYFSKREDLARIWAEKNNNVPSYEMLSSQDVETQLTQAASDISDAIKILSEPNKRADIADELTLQAKIAFEMKDTTMALQSIDKALTIKQTSERVELKTKYLMNIERYNEACNFIDSIDKKVMTNKLINLQAVIYRELGNIDKAIESYREARNSKDLLRLLLETKRYDLVHSFIDQNKISWRSWFEELYQHGQYDLLLDVILKDKSHERRTLKNWYIIWLQIALGNEAKALTALDNFKIPSKVTYNTYLTTAEMCAFFKGIA